MPNNIKIEGDDAVWKRGVDSVIATLQSKITMLENRVKYLESRVK